MKEIEGHEKYTKKNCTEAEWPCLQRNSQKEMGTGIPQIAHEAEKPHYRQESHKLKCGSEF